MRTWKWTITASLLIALSASAQQTMTPAPSSPAQPALQSAPADSPAAAPSSSPQPAAVTAAPAPTTSSVTTMDQVVDRAIEREHALIAMLKTRTPLVETYLQNLKLDPQMGPSPKEDHYFLGRLDLSDSVDRQDYLSKDSSFQTRMMGGFTKMFKFQYQPVGFSWMIFADREDFDRAHYEFKYVHREFQGDVRCIVFDVTPKKDAGKGTLPGPYLGGRPGFQHRAAQRHLCSSAAKRAVLPYGQLAPEPDSRLLGAVVHLQ